MKLGLIVCATAALAACSAPEPDYTGVLARRTVTLPLSIVKIRAWLPGFGVPDFTALISPSRKRPRRGPATGALGGAELIVRERRRLRRQDLERPFPVLRRCRGQAPARGQEGQEEGGGGHKVEHAVDAEACHRARADERTSHRTEPTYQDELAAYHHDSVGWHASVKVHDL
jgi:hypothetical protein